MTVEVFGGSEREAHRKSRVWLCSAQLVFMFYCGGQDEQGEQVEQGRLFVWGFMRQHGQLIWKMLVNFRCRMVVVDDIL
jgi:hypothetical protein